MAEVSGANRSQAETCSLPEGRQKGSAQWRILLGGPCFFSALLVLQPIRKEVFDRGEVHWLAGGSLENFIEHLAGLDLRDGA